MKIRLKRNSTGLCWASMGEPQSVASCPGAGGGTQIKADDLSPATESA
jgi:hypothetical protein